jgi:hypothetical protein
MSKDYSFFGWMKFVYNTNDKQVFSLCNAEGFMYLYFLRTTGFFFLIISIFSILVFIPLFTINFFEYKHIDLTTLQKLTIKNAYLNKGKLWLVLFFSFLYTFMAYYHVYNYKKKLEMIHTMVQTEDSMDSDMSLHTIHIRGLNRNLSYLDAKKILQSFFDIQFSGLVCEIQVIPSYDKLMDLIERKFTTEAYINKFKNLNMKNSQKRAVVKIGEGLCKGRIVDAEVYYKNWLNIIENMLRFYRQLNAKKNTGNAFISFSNPYTVENILNNKKIIKNQANTFHGKLLNIEVRK